jgi:indolepyruvate ferredoxin oxidoreductase alpha subunit
MVIVVADDPGPISSQTEQDTRHYAKFAKMALFNPSTPEEAYTMIADAFEHSEKYGVPVLFRPTTRVCHSCSTVEILEDLPVKESVGFVKDSKWVIFPRLSYANHIKIEEKLIKMREEFAGYKNNILMGTGKKGIATGGVTYTYCREARAGEESKLFKVSTVPFPDKLALKFLEGLDEVLVIEDLDPVIEDELVRVCGLNKIDVKILGKHTGHIQNAGEITVDVVIKAVNEFLGTQEASLSDTKSEQPRESTRATPPPLPTRLPVLCAGCTHRAAFYAVKQATKGISAVFTGDIGCYTLGNAPPLNMVDTCLCMGGGITVAQGLRRIEPDTVHFAFIGDSTFFHSGMTGLLNAVYNQTDIVVVILDNWTTAMTGNQPHPGMGVTMMGGRPEKLSIAKIVEAMDVSVLHRIDPRDIKAAEKAVRDVIDKKGVRVILFDAPCIYISKNETTAVLDAGKCSGCMVCIMKYGCPAVSRDQAKVRIDANLCTGCGVCGQICSMDAIKMEGNNDDKM